MQEFKELYEEYNRLLYAFLLKLTDYNPDVAEELTQETFFQAYQSLHRYKGKSGIYTWLCGIAKNVACKYFRKTPIPLTLDAAELQKNLESQGFGDLQEMAERKELVSFLLKEVLALDGKYKDVMIYRLFFELSFQETADAMGIKENSAKVIYFRAKEKVRRKMEESYGKE